MGGWIKPRYTRCAKCGRPALGRSGLPLCKPCQKIQKVQPVDLLLRLATCVGLLPQSYFDALEQLEREYRCTGCRSVSFGEAVTCETCMEHRYCSFQCLQVHKLKHTPVCLYILMAKGISYWCQRVLPKNLFRIFFQAKTLDDTGHADFRMLHYSDKLHVTVARQGVFKQSSIDTFAKNPANLIRTFPRHGQKKHFQHKSPDAKMLIKRVKKTKQVILETKKQNENVSVDNVMETVGNNLMKVTNKTKHCFHRFRDVKRVISSGKFAGCVCDDGITFGVGWWKCLPNNKPKKQTLKTEVKPFAAALNDIEEPVSGLTFSDFYGDSDSEEIQQETEDACGMSNSTGISTEPISTISRISPDLPTSTFVENKQELQGTMNPLPPVSESMQALPVNKITTGKQKRIRNAHKKQEVWDSCMFCRHLSNNLKTCARCGLAKYCSKPCQMNGHSAHKQICKKMSEMNRVVSMIPSIVTAMLTSKYGTSEISFNCDNVPMAPWDMHHVHALVKIVDVTICIQGIFVITVEDSRGMQESVCLRHPLPYSLFHNADFGKPLSLKDCLQPGNYILLIDAHMILCFGTSLACDDHECFFIIMK